MSHHDAYPPAADPVDSAIDAEAPPSAPYVGQPEAGDPLAGEDAATPPLAGPELGGEMVRGADALDRAVDALLRLAADRPWPAISLRDVARGAGVGFAELYSRAPGKTALLARLSERLDAQALRATEGDDQAEVHDRLFEAFMSRLEAMEPYRAVLIAVARAETLAVAGRIPRTARALAEAAGVDTGGARGAARLAALTGVWARTLQVWRDDEGALNRTMAEIDKRLKTADARLRRIGAGF